MNSFAFKRTLLVFCVVMPSILAGCSHDRVKKDNTADTTSISNQLRQVYFKLRAAMDDGDRFPASFSQLKYAKLDGQLFVCPGSGSRAGTMDTIESWSDFIYVGNDSEGVPELPLLISPPENHRGEYGYIIFVDGRISKTPPEVAARLVREPWFLATNSPPANVEYEKNRISVFVPRKFQSEYRDAYKSVPGR